MFSPDNIRVWHSSNSILHTPPSQHSLVLLVVVCFAEHTSELMMSGSVIFIVEIFHQSRWESLWSRAQRGESIESIKLWQRAKRRRKWVTLNHFSLDEFKIFHPPPVYRLQFYTPLPSTTARSFGECSAGNERETGRSRMKNFVSTWLCSMNKNQIKG